MEDEDTRDYVVLVNIEEQYSLWLAGSAVPNGWRQVGPTGKKPVCLEFVKEVWTDMRPLSLRKAMAEHAAKVAAEKENAQPTAAAGDGNDAGVSGQPGPGAQPEASAESGAGV
jgi:MbtH protein